MNQLLLHLLFAASCMAITDKQIADNFKTSNHLNYAVATCTTIAVVHEFWWDTPPDQTGFVRSMSGITGMYLLKYNW
jgi:hypothetical protein